MCCRQPAWGCSRNLMVVSDYVDLAGWTEMYDGSRAVAVRGLERRSEAGAGRRAPRRRSSSTDRRYMLRARATRARCSSNPSPEARRPRPCAADIAGRRGRRATARGVVSAGGATTVSSRPDRVGRNSIVSSGGDLGGFVERRRSLRHDGLPVQEPTCTPSAARRSLRSKRVDRDSTSVATASRCAVGSSID